MVCRMAQRMELRLRNADTPAKPTEAELPIIFSAMPTNS